MLLAQLSTGAQFSEAVVDFLHAIHGMPHRHCWSQAFDGAQS